MSNGQTIELLKSHVPVKDPVCGMTVDPATANASLEHEGTTYHFCSTGCAQKFEADPGRYIASGSTKSCGGGEAAMKPEPTHGCCGGQGANEAPAGPAVASFAPCPPQQSCGGSGFIAALPPQQDFVLPDAM